MPKFQKRHLLWALLALLLAAGALVHGRLTQSEASQNDIYYSWVEGRRILAGENPYARVLAGDLRHNDKYATYFPVFYELSALSQWAGRREYEPWIAFWRPVFLLFNLGIAAVLFVLAHQRGRAILAVFGAAFWLFNRWTLNATQMNCLDPIPIFLLLLSLGLWPRHRLPALLLFSLSLGVKQIAIFLVPLYLIWAWQNAERTPWKQAVLAALAIASVPVVTSLPFLFGNAEGFLKSILFSAIRVPEWQFGADSIDTLLGWSGLAARLPMLVLMALVYAAACRRMIGPFAAALLVMATFVDFNTLLFPQYLLWVVPFVPLAVCDLTDAGSRASQGRTTQTNQ